MQQNKINSKYVEFAIEIIKTKNSEVSIRDWATQVIDELSPIKLTPDALNDFKIDWMAKEKAILQDYKFNLTKTESHLAVKQNSVIGNIDRIILLSSANNCRLENSIGNNKSTVYNIHEKPSDYFEQLEIPLFPLPLVKACLGLPPSVKLENITAFSSNEDFKKSIQDKHLINVYLAIIFSDDLTTGVRSENSQLRFSN